MSGAKDRAAERRALQDQAPRELPTVLTAAEVAKFLRVSRKTVYDAVATGDLPGFRIGNRLRFHRDEVLRLFRQERVVPNRTGRRR
ncbi:MAG: helix-turn-helix domain-containing protein [Nannocystaceae bacterium]|nr:helix-turn-helix domain-containing protein [bacterium]